MTLPRLSLLFRLCLACLVAISMTSCVDEDEYTNSPSGNFEALWRIMDEHYCFFSQKGVDWNEVYQRYSRQIDNHMSENQQFEVLCNMLSELRDGHVNLYSTFDIGRNWSWREDYPSNFSDTLSRRYLGTDYRIASGISYRILDDNIGYMRCSTFANGFGEGNLDDIMASDIHARLGLEKGKYILLSAHREENIDTEKNFLSLFNAINAIARKYDMPILYSCHPRSRKRLEQSGFELDKRVIRHEPLGFHDYNCLQMNAAAVISDSGTLPEESSFFTSVGHPFPAVCIRTSTERPESLDNAGFILAGIDEKSLLQAVDTAIAMNRNHDDGTPVNVYVGENVSNIVVKIIQSYVTVVNKMVWRKA